jgi:hypothetical protein
VLPGAALHHMGVQEGFTFRPCGQSFVAASAAMYASHQSVFRYIAHIRGGVFLLSRQCEGASIVCDVVSVCFTHW